MGIGFGEHDAATFDTTFAGINLEGFGTDQAIKIEPNADHRSTRVGLDGHVVSSKNNDKSATVTVTLKKTSRAHRALLALYSLDQNTPGGAGAGVFSMRDRLGGATESSPVAWIMRRPDMVVAGEDPEFEWKLTLAQWGTTLDGAQ